MKWNKFKIQLHEEKIDGNIFRYENHQKIFTWSEFVTYKSIDEGASQNFVATEKLADQMLACMSRWSERVLTGPYSEGPAVEKLTCMGRWSEGMLAGSHSKKSAVEMLICMKPMIESVGRMKIT